MFLFSVFLLSYNDNMQPIKSNLFYNFHLYLNKNPTFLSVCLMDGVGCHSQMVMFMLF